MKKLLLVTMFASTSAFAQGWVCEGNEPAWRAEFGPKTSVLESVINQSGSRANVRTIDFGKSMNNSNIEVVRFDWGDVEYTGVAVIRQESCRETMKDSPDSFSVTISGFRTTLVGCCSKK